MRNSVHCSDSNRAFCREATNSSYSLPLLLNTASKLEQKYNAALRGEQRYTTRLKPLCHKHKN
ncbi:hypothetical protein CGI81_23585 [Vibrio parahaemolyticus]|nr:hypothetical protein CGI81_23585 [Vibrio parahaemolyticus]